MAITDPKKFHSLAPLDSRNVWHSISVSSSFHGNWAVSYPWFYCLQMVKCGKICCITVINGGAWYSAWHFRILIINPLPTLFSHYLSHNDQKLSFQCVWPHWECQYVATIKVIPRQTHTANLRKIPSHSHVLFCRVNLRSTRQTGSPH